MIWTALTTAGAFLKRIPWQVWLVLAVLLCAWLWGNHRYSQGIHDERSRWEAAAAKAKARADKASADAAQQRIEDIVHNIDQQREREDAIEQAVPAGSPSTAPDAANRALACVRLRQAGKHAAAAKAGCGSSN